ncbi:MAG: alpha/beta hydrolase fold domain-containing protein [Treponema sp.]|nr:alpha/beta hydrolase fold domain-containing protein [Treponema sp.]
MFTSVKTALMITISPMYGNFNGFPPTFITCDYNETLFADSIWLYRKLQEIGIKVKMIQMRGAFHAFATTGTQAPETATILKENVEFIKENMACYNSF